MNSSSEQLKLPPNAAKALSLYLKGSAQWAREDEHRVFALVADWSGADHLAFADFLERVQP